MPGSTLDDVGVELHRERVGRGVTNGPRLRREQVGRLLRAVQLHVRGGAMCHPQPPGIPQGRCRAGHRAYCGSLASRASLDGRCRGDRPLDCWQVSGDRSGHGHPPVLPAGAIADRSAIVISGVNGSWSVRKPNHTVEIDSSAPAPPLICGADGLPPGCDFFDRSIGPKTPEGIASQAAPGHVDAYLGVGIAERFVLSAPFWAVRTGPVHHHT
jgi:hypothetical protein